MGGLASVVQLWLRNQLGSNCILHYESQCANTGRRTGVHKAIILTNCQRAPALSCCSLTAYPSFLGIPCTSFWKSLWCNPDPHHTKRETAADPYLLWHSADHSAGGNCFNAAGSNLPSFVKPGSQMIKVHPKLQGLVRAGGELTWLGSRLGLQPVLGCAMVSLPVRCMCLLFCRAII